MSNSQEVILGILNSLFSLLSTLFGSGESNSVSLHIELCVELPHENASKDPLLLNGVSRKTRVVAKGFPVRHNLEVKLE